MAVRVQYTYCHSYCDLQGYFDRGGVGQYVYSTRTGYWTYMDTLTEGGEERVAVRVQYTYCHSYCDLHGYSDRGGKRREWQYVYSTHTATVNVTYMDTLTEGGRGVSGSTCTVHILPQLL